MRTWTPRAYELSRERVAELQRFCWQYREKLARISAMRGAAGSSEIDGMPHGQGGIGRPTEQTALRIIDSRDARDVEMIESAAREAAGGSAAMYACLIANICDRVLFEHMHVPAGRRQFYDARRRFFGLLDQKR